MIDSRVTARAAEIADQLHDGVRAGRAVEWLEQIVIAALLEIQREERERCATIADRRAKLWEDTARRMRSGSWPASAAAEARERLKEAVVIADAIRAAG